MFGQAEVGAVTVLTTSGRGWTPEELAERFVDRLISVSETAPMPIREQALAYREQVYRLAVHHMRQATLSDRTTLFNKLTEAGHHEAAALIQRL